MKQIAATDWAAYPKVIDLFSSQSNSLGGRHGVSKKVGDSRRPATLWAATLEIAVRLFKGWLPAGRRGVEHGGP
jgi:hypothetical protein